MSRYDQCRSCGAEIFWQRTNHGRMAPINASPTPDGNVVICDTPQLADALGTVFGRAVTLGGARLEAARAAPNRDLYVNHYATCPDRKKWAEHRERDGA